MARAPVNRDSRRGGSESLGGLHPPRRSPGPSSSGPRLVGSPRTAPARARAPPPPSSLARVPPSSSGLRCGRSGRPGARRDQPADHHVLLEAAQVVALARDGGLGEHPGGLLERRRGDEGFRRQRSLGDAEQQRSNLAGCPPSASRAARWPRAPDVSTCSPRMKSESPGSSINRPCAASAGR